MNQRDVEFLSPASWLSPIGITPTEPNEVSECGVASSRISFFDGGFPAISRDPVVVSFVLRACAFTMLFGESSSFMASTRDFVGGVPNGLRAFGGMPGTPGATRSAGTVGEMAAGAAGVDPATPGSLACPHVIGTVKLTISVTPTLARHFARFMALTSSPLIVLRLKDSHSRCKTCALIHHPDQNGEPTKVACKKFKVCGSEKGGLQDGLKSYFRDRSLRDRRGYRCDEMIVSAL